MSILQAIALGIVQGLTEFLPISSSAHLTLVPWVLNWNVAPDLTFDTLVHLGTLAAVLAYFWRDVIALLRGWWQSLRTRRIETSEARLAWLLIVATVPGALLGYFGEDYVSELLGAPAVVAALLLVTGLLLFVSERLGRRERALEQVTLADALIAGVAQGCAILPGISRSGATMAAGLFRGLTREAAARFSFLLSLPISAGATAAQAYKAASSGLTLEQAIPLIVGPLAALVAGYLAIRLLLGYVRTHSLRPFAYYCWAAGVFVLVLAWVR